jgi:2-oxoisovalerate dehydrogenase E1 component
MNQFEKELFKKELVVDVFSLLYKSRRVDEKMEKLVKQNKGTSFYLSTAGHELVGITIAKNLISKKDHALPYYRDRAFVIALGSPLIDLFGSFMARKVDSHSGGRMMPDHFCDKRLKIVCQSSVVGTQFLQAVGVARAIDLKNLDEVVYVSAGEGATSQGDFHEALNYASIHKLNVIFVIQDNGYAISVKVSEQTSGGNIAKIARGYTNLNVFEVDGTDFFELDKISKKAILNAREKKGPSLIVAKVPRINSHTISDDHKKYRASEEILKDFQNDPLSKLENFLLEKKLISKEELNVKKHQINEEIEEAAIAAEKVGFPKKEEASLKIFKEFDFDKASLIEASFSKTPHIKTSTDEIVIMDAINNALVEEMQRDEKIVVFGEDVAHEKGGVFGITKTLTKKFGKNRCFNTPLAESTIIGLAIGMSLNGNLKPVVEIQFADYIYPALNQLVNELASIHYRSDGHYHCPIVIRIPYGGYIQGGPYHSQSIESFLLHVPGLKVVVPSNAKDAKRLFKTALKDPNPVVFLEHKSLYRQRVFCANVEPHADEMLEFGKAKIVNKGSDITIVCFGKMVLMALETAKELAKEKNISIEVIDLRSLNPLDEKTISKSLKKTSKLLVLQEGFEKCSFASEIIAIMQGYENFSNLDAPISRVCAKDCSIPYAKTLEDEVLPQKEDLKKEILKLHNY